MSQKIILFIFVLFIEQFAANAQENDSLQTGPDSMNVHTPGIARPQKLKIKEQLNIELEGVEKPIINTYTSAHDNTLKTDTTQVKSHETEANRTKNPIAIGLGSLFLITGVTLAGTGLIILSDTADQKVIGVTLKSLAGSGALFIDGVSSLIGIIILTKASSN